jgi:hydrogenase expression/formation protein HypC
MCLAVPGKIVELTGEQAVVDLYGIRREANVSFIENPALGDYVLLHAGFAIERWSAEDVREYEELLRGLPEIEGADRSA